MDAIAEQLVSRLETDPNDAQAYEALKAHYREVHDPASLTNLVAGWAAFQSDPLKASRGYYEAAQIVATVAPQHERRLELLRKAVETDIGFRDAVLELSALLENHGDYNALAEFLDQHLRTLEELLPAHGSQDVAGRDVLDDRDMQDTQNAHAFMATLYARLGDLWLRRFEQADVAHDCYERALELDGANAEVAAAARALAKTTGDATLLARALGAEAAAESSPERKRALFRAQAEAYAREPVDLNGAVQALRAAHDLAPNDVPTMRELADMLGRRAQTAKPEAAARDLRRSAELHFLIAQLVSPSEALSALQAVLQAVPHHDGALCLLEQHAQQLGREDLLQPYWLAYITHAAEGPEVDQRRLRLALAYERSGRLDEAIGYLEQVQTPGMASSMLTELKVRRGPRGPRTGRELSPSSPVPSASDGQKTTGRNQAPSVTSTARMSVPPALQTFSDTTPTTGTTSRSRSSERPLDADRLLRELRRTLRNAIAAGDHAEVVQRCLEIRDIDPSDAEAFSLLESHYRKQADHEQLRELLMCASQIAGLPLDERKQHLREVAALDEGKLRRVDDAIEVLRSVVALDPQDGEALGSLKRLLQRTQRWDDLVEVLNAEVHHKQTTDEKVALLSQIVAVHRERRHDPAEALEALRQLFSLRPTTATREDLCELLLASDAHAEAVPLLWQRAEQAEGEREYLRVLRQLTELYETKLQDNEAAYDVSTRILALRPKDQETLERMQRIDERSGNTLRLLSTLERRAALLLRSERASLLLEMATIAERSLDDVERAGEYYRRALELDPARPGVLDALFTLFESRDRYVELAALLDRTALQERDAARRSELRLRQARVHAGPLTEPSKAAAAYREVLEHGENTEALSYLLKLAREDQDSEATAGLCARLAATFAARTEDRAQNLASARSLLYERAQVLVTELGRPRDAITTLQTILKDIDPSYEPAIEWLAELSGNLGDTPGLASALARRLELSTTQDARVALAKRLADLQEHELADSEQACAALSAWAKADPSDIVPQRRLRRLLEQHGRFAELVASCDALAQLEPEQDARDEATLHGAQVAFLQLRNFDAAWSRLVPLVQHGQAAAIQLALSIARQADRCDELAALCVRAAQEATGLELQGQLWAQTVKLYRDELGSPSKAFEAALRLLATDLRNRDALTQVEECAALAGQWARLVPVYDRLLKAAASDGERIELLLRHADLLERRAQRLSDALDRVLQASALAPTDETLVVKAEQLAARCGRGHELLSLCEQQAAAAEQPAAQVEWLLRAARFAASAGGGRAAAGSYLEAALAATRADVALWELCISHAQQLDAQATTGEPNAALRALIAAHRRVAERCPAPIGATLILRASRLLDDRLDDERAAFDLLRAGASMFPLDENLYESLLERAEADGRLDALDVHLARGVEDALDARTAASLLARRARLLEGQLGRPDDAANVYVKLLGLRPDDQQATSKLRETLRRAHRFQDLLVVIHKQSQRAKSVDEKVELLKESAHIWELDIKNRWEAVDAWRKVLELAPEDGEAQRAVGRLDRRSLSPSSPGSAGASGSLPPSATRGKAVREAAVSVPPVEARASVAAAEPVARVDADVDTLISVELPAAGREATPPSAAKPDAADGVSQTKTDGSVEASLADLSEALDRHSEPELSAADGGEISAEIALVDAEPAPAETEGANEPTTTPTSVSAEEATEPLAIEDLPAVDLMALDDNDASPEADGPRAKRATPPPPPASAVSQRKSRARGTTTPGSPPPPNSSASARPRKR